MATPRQDVRDGGRPSTGRRAHGSAEARRQDPDLDRTDIGTSHGWTQRSQQAPLIDLLGEIRGLRGLRHRGQISEVEYERRRRQVLSRI